MYIYTGTDTSTVIITVTSTVTTTITQSVSIVHGTVPILICFEIHLRITSQRMIKFKRIHPQSLRHKSPEPFVSQGVNKGVQGYVQGQAMCEEDLKPLGDVVTLTPQYYKHNKRGVGGYKYETDKRDSQDCIAGRRRFLWVLLSGEVEGDQPEARGLLQRGQVT